MNSAALCTTQASPARSGVFNITPHSQYASSIGVLGCKINVNRVAHWPFPPKCNDICVNISLGDRSTHVLHIDISTGAHDISYDAYNYLVSGASATENPVMGGEITMEYEFVNARDCEHLLDGGKLPLSAANSMNYVSNCLSEGDNWAAENHKLYNIFDSQCTLGVDELCDLNWPEENQADCPHGLGSQADIHGLAVVNVEYGTGKEAA